MRLALAVGALLWAACAPEVVRVELPLELGGGALVVLVESQTATGDVVRRIHVRAKPEPAAAIDAIDFPPDVTLVITAHEYAETLTDLGLVEGPLREPTPGAAIAHLPTPTRAMRRVLGSGASSWAPIEASDAPLVGLPYTRHDAEILPPFCTHTRRVYEAAVVGGIENPVLANVLADGSALILLRGGGGLTAPLPPAVMVRADPNTRTQTSLMLPPEIMPRSAVIVEDGAMWVGSVNGRIHRLTYVDGAIETQEITVAGASGSVAWISAVGRGLDARVMGITSEGEVFELRSGVPTPIGRVDPVDASTDKGAVTPLADGRMVASFARASELTVFAPGGATTSITPRERIRGYFTVTPLEDGTLVAGGSDNSFTFFPPGGSVERVAVIDDGGGQWVRRILAVGDGRYWWGGKFGKGGEYVEGSGFCPTQDIGPHNVRELVRWGDRGYLVVMEGTGGGSGTPSFVFHAWVRD